MLLKTLSTLITRDLNKLKEEISAYKSEEALWMVDKNIPNSGGNLCLHLIGNLKTYIGAHLGNNGYIRNRPHEFSLKNIPREELLNQIDETIIDVRYALRGLTEEVIKKEYPFEVFQQKTSTEYLLVHLTTHLTYHLGQINYHRRLLDT